MLFLLGARLKFDATVIFVAVAFEAGWNRIDRFPVVALQHGSVLQELLAIKRENLVSRVWSCVVLQVKTRAVISPVEGDGRDLKLETFARSRLQMASSTLPFAIRC